MSLALARLADEIGVSERTLRRSVGSELIHAQRPSSRRLVVSEREAAWVRLHWSLVGRLRGALRTEPNAELAVLFGSAARGDDLAGSSDVDLLVRLRRSYPGALEAMRGRLNEHVRPEVQLVPLQAALRNPLLMAEVLRDGRPLVDRSGRWPELKARAEQTDAQAARIGRELRTDAQAAIGYFQRLADARARSPVGTGR